CRGLCIARKLRPPRRKRPDGSAASAHQDSFETQSTKRDRKGDQIVMSNINGVGSTSGTGYVSGGNIEASGMSPDGILAYCEFQLNGLGNQTDQMIQQQETQ